MKSKYYSRRSREVTKQLPWLSIDAIRLYLCLESYADWNTGVCWPSYRTILQNTPISNGKRLKIAIFVLVDAGLIETWLKGQRRYYKLLDSLVYDN